MIKLHKEEHIIEVNHLGIFVENLLSEILVFNTKTFIEKLSKFKFTEIFYLNHKQEMLKKVKL